MEHEELTGQIIQIYFKVYNELGYGFIESVYHKAMILELAKAGLTVETERPIAVHYDGQVVGAFSADLVVEGKVMLELKAKESLHPAHEAQLTNYLRATDIEVGLLLNFGKKPEFKRKYFSNSNKKRSNIEDRSALSYLLEEPPPPSHEQV